MSFGKIVWVYLIFFTKKLKFLKNRQKLTDLSKKCKLGVFWDPLGYVKIS